MHANDFKYLIIAIIANVIITGTVMSQHICLVDSANNLKDTVISKHLDITKEEIKKLPVTTIDELLDKIIGYEITESPVQFSGSGDSAIFWQSGKRKWSTDIDKDKKRTISDLILMVENLNYHFENEQFWKITGYYNEGESAFNTKEVEYFFKYLFLFNK